MSLRDAAQQALRAMDYMLKHGELYHAQDHADALREALAENERDWSLLEATQESLREHMAEIQTLRAALAQPAANFEEWFTRVGHDESDRFIAGLAWNAGMDCAVQSPLTGEKIIGLWASVSCDDNDEINIIELARAIEAAHGIKEQP